MSFGWVTQRWTAYDGDRCVAYNLWAADKDKYAVNFIWIVGKGIYGSIRYEDSNGEDKHLPGEMFEGMSLHKIKKYMETIARMEGHE